MTIRPPLSWVLALSLGLNLLLVPLAKDEYLRFQYRQVLAKWLGHVWPPHAVFIGDSITASGRSFNDWRDINLGTSGLETHQVANLVTEAQKWRPRVIVVMAGTNDAGKGPIDVAAISGQWERICRLPGLVVTLPPPTAFDDFNARLAAIRPVIRSRCAQRPIIDLGFLADRSGRIQPRYTADGIHLSPAAIALWRQALARAGV